MAKRYWLLLMLGATGACAGEQTSRRVPGAASPDSTLSDTAQVNPDGYYFLEGPLPPWAERIDHLSLSYVALQRSPVVSAPLIGWIHFKADGPPFPRYRLITPTLGGRRLTFATEVVNGVSFAFEGAFQLSGELAKLQPGGVVLTGRLQRLEGGRIVEGIDVRFTYFVGD